MGGTFSKKTRIVVIVDTIARPGGGERLAVENAIRLDPNRFDRTLCITRWDDELERTQPAASMLARLRAADVRVIGLRRSSRLALWSWWPLLSLLRRQRIDVVHGHLFGSNVWAALLGRLARVPAIVAHEHMWAYGSGAGNRLRPLLDRELIARLADAFVAVSAEGQRRMIESERISPREIVLIENGIAGFEAGDGARVREELGIDPAAPLIGSVGHLRPEKAFDVLLEAVAQLRRSHPELALLIVGEGPERAELEGRIEALGLTGAVHLPGSRDDVPNILAALDVAVCCSDFEGGPLSVMEYMEAGLPVVGSRVGGLPELIEEGGTGLLVPPRQPAELAAALARLLDDPALRERLGSRGRELRRQRWDLGVWARRLEELYEDLLVRSRR